jgi:hypothetical protein
MAYFEEFTFTTANDAIARLKLFAEANGWTVDLYSEGTNYRLHIHKGVAHFDLLAYNSSSQIALYGCTGYDSGATNSTQPNTSLTSIYYDQFIVGDIIYLISCIGIMVVKWWAAPLFPNRATMYMGNITDKVGVWADGIFVKNFVLASSAANDTFGPTIGDIAFVYVNGQWTAKSSNGVNRLIGLAVNDDYTNSVSNLGISQPNTFNAAIIPFPIPLCQANSLTATVWHPLGFIPNVYRIRGGDVYVDKEIINISGSEYIVIEGRYGIPKNHTLLVKLGA